MTLQPPPDSEPVMVRIVEPSNESQLEQLGEVLLGSIGLVGVIAVLAVLVGALVAGLMVWLRSRGDD